MRQGWVKLHRQLSDNELWLSEKFTRGQAWVDLILHANHKDGIMNIRGNIIKIKRGQIGWSELTMAKRWTWSKNKVRRFLNLLETIQQIEQQKLYKITTIITVLNYEKYQNDTTDDTTDGQQTDNRRYTNKNDKNDKNVKNNNIKDFSTEKSSLKVNKDSMKYNEQQSSDSYEDKIDHDTGEKIKEVKKEGKNIIASRLQKYFVETAEKELGVKPMYNKVGYILLCRALKHLEEEKIKELFEDWFNEAKPEEDLIQITQALSANYLNRWKIKYK